MSMATESQIAETTCKEPALTSAPRHYNKDGEAVFITAACGVIMNTETHVQKVYGGH